jgi:hypothetical protein
MADMVLVVRFRHGAMLCVIKQGGGEERERETQFEFSPKKDMTSHVNSNNNII